MPITPPPVLPDPPPVVTTSPRGALLQRLRPFAEIFLVAIVVAPLAIVLHEIGHYLAQLALGYEDVPFVSYDSSVQGEIPPHLPDWTNGLTSSAGPLVSLVLVLASVLMVRRGGPVSIALTLLTADCLRVVGTLAMAVSGAEGSVLRELGAGFGEFGTPLSLLGFEAGALLLSVVDFAVPFVALAVVYRVLRGRGDRALRAKLAFSMLSVVAAAALWLTVTGPLLLP